MVVGSTTPALALTGAPATGKCRTTSLTVKVDMESFGRAIVTSVEESLVPDVMTAEVAVVDEIPCC